MRLLYLCQRIPFPPDRGDRILVFHQIKKLSRNHEVVAGSLAHTGSRRNAENLEKELGVKLIAPDHTVFRQATGMAASLLRDKPLSLGYFRNPKLQTLLDAEKNRKPFDAIMIFSSSMAQYVESYRQIPRIMHFCDLDSQKWRALAERSNWMMRRIYRREHRLLLEYERKIAAEFGAACVVSNNEADLFRKNIPGIPVHVLENGVDVDYFAARPRRPESLRIVFVGVMNYAPNVEAVLFFANHIWSKIHSAFPNSRFVVVGSKPIRRIRNMAKVPGVEVTGYVSDIRSYLASATIMVAPLAVARGVQNKILESMAAGVPVLTTPCVVRGLPDGAESHVFAAEREPESFGSALLKLIGNPLALEEKAAAAQDFVKKHCSWEIKLKALDGLIERVTAQEHLPPDPQIS